MMDQTLSKRWAKLSLSRMNSSDDLTFHSMIGYGAFAILRNKKGEYKYVSLKTGQTLFQKKAGGSEKTWACNSDPSMLVCLKDNRIW